MKTTWIKAAPDTLPEHTNWVLIVINGASRGVPDHVGMGWRKCDSAGQPTGWWETNHGLMTDEYITHWMHAPALPKP